MPGNVSDFFLDTIQHTQHTHGQDEPYNDAAPLAPLHKNYSMVTETMNKL